MISEIYLHIRMPAVCFLIVIYSIIRLHTKKPLKTSTYLVYKAMSVIGAIQLLFAAITEFTVNHVQISTTANNPLFIISLVSATSFIALLIYYVTLQIEKRICKPLKEIKTMLVICFVIFVIGEIVLPIEYIKSPFGTYAYGAKVLCLYIFEVIAVIFILFGFIKFRKALVLKLYHSLIAILSVLTLSTILQFIFPYIMFTAPAVTIIVVELMINLENTHMYISSTTTLYNKKGCQEILNELLLSKKSFGVGVYIFVGNTEETAQSMLSVKKKLNSTKGIICGMFDDDTMLLIPTHSPFRSYSLPEELPSPEILDNNLSLSKKVIDCSKYVSVSEIFETITEFRDTYEESVIQKDGLTNAIRRPLLIHQVETLIKNEQDFTFLMLDLDDFKHINDNYGHQMGDKVLQTISNTLLSVLRSTDIICRMGGDEFGIVLLNLTEPKKIQDIICRVYNEINFMPELSGLFRVTFSIGICVNSEGFKRGSFNEIYTEADDALYCSKLNGKCLMTFSRDKKPISIQ